MTPSPPPLNSLRARLLIGSGIPLALFVGVALISLSVLYQLLDALGQERHSHQLIVKTLQQQDQLDRMILTVQYCPVSDPDRWKSHYEASRKAFREANDAAQDLASGEPKQEERLRTLRDLEDQWHQRIEKEPAAARPPDFLPRSQELADQIQRQLAAVLSDEEAALAGRRQHAEHQAWQGGWVIIGALVVVTLASVVIAWRMARSVTRPIDRLRQAAGHLLAGRFEMERVKGPNEIAQLIVDFNQIGLSLAQSLSSLREQEEGYRQYIGAVSQLMWRTNAEGEVVGDLPSWQTFTGQSGEQVRGAGWLDAVHPEDRPGVLEQWGRAVRERRLFEAECRLRSARRRPSLLRLPRRAHRQPGRLGAGMDRHLYGYYGAERAGTPAPGQGGGRGGERGQERVSGAGQPRAADAAERRHRHVAAAGRAAVRPAEREAGRLRQRRAAAPASTCWR